MKIEMEVKAFGKIQVQGAKDAFKGLELMRVHKLSKDTTLGGLEALLSSLFEEVENGYKNPEQCVGKIIIRAKKENGAIVYLDWTECAFTICKSVLSLTGKAVIVCLSKVLDFP